MSWPLVKLGDLAISGKGSYGLSLPSRQWRPGDHRYIRITDIADDGTLKDARVAVDGDESQWKSAVLNEGDILFARSGATVGKTYLHPPKSPPSVYAGYLIRFVLDTERVVPRFAFHYTRSGDYLSWVSSTQRAVAQPNINAKQYSRLEIPLPSLSEQVRIVEILDDHLSRLDAGCSELERAAAKLANLRERAIVQALVAGWETKRADPSLTDVGAADGALSSLPIGWSWSRLGDIADVVGGVTKDAKKQSDPTYVEVPYLRVANVQRGRLNLNAIATIRVPQAKADALRLRRGDVLLNEGGDRDKLARGWVWEEQIPDCIHQNHVFRARITDPRVDPYFLSWTTNTIGGRWAERNGKQSVNLASISLSMIRRMPVIVPPEGVAARITRKLQDTQSNFDRLEKSICDGMDRSVVLRKSLLSAAFSGRLTSSSDELLEELEFV